MGLGNDMYSLRVHDRMIIENDGKRQCESYRILFPYHCFKMDRHDSTQTDVDRTKFQTTMFKTKLFSKFNVFPKIYALDTSATDTSSNNTNESTNKINETQTAASVVPSRSIEQLELEAIARAYIAKETGMDRVRNMFQKNHKGDSSPEMFAIKVSLVNIFAIFFFMKYVPAWKDAKKDFIAEHNATTFRTRIEAARKMSDFASVRGLLEGIPFAMKVTSFCAGFLVISQTISAYRNKTSPLEYTLAAGIAGGAARIHLGPKGIFAGSLVGLVLGSVFGSVACVLFYACGEDQKSRHLKNIMDWLEVERSIVGDSVYKQRLVEIMENMDSASTS